MRTSQRATPTPFLLVSALLYAAGMGLHGLDHLRRGMSTDDHHASWPGWLQMMLSGVAILVGVGAVLVVRSGYHLAPHVATVIGLGSAGTFLLLHLSPQWTGVADSFVSASAGARVTAWSWFTAGVGVSGCLLLGVVGLREVRAQRGARLSDLGPTEPSSPIDTAIPTT